MSKSNFTIEEMDIKLKTNFIGTNFIFYDEIGSTNEELLNDKSITQHGTVLFADNQVKGRGRLNREWISYKDNSITFSILLTENLNSKTINLINLAAAISVAQSIENLFQLDLRLKWPNDVLIATRKVCGILVESISKGDKLERVVIGIGVNVNQPMFEGHYNVPPTSIRKEHGKVVSRERLLAEILNEFEKNLKKVNKSPNDILSNWKSKCKMIGEKIKVQDGEKEFFGIFEDIDENGFLLLKDLKGTKKIFSGDVSPR
ncbi:MAG: biotin--[acetyl-CoA-carboxylase] ligase [Bacteroidetes bacterium]|nr:biotin--[acetyl-CoA-carboxylase] ligase [Bacteroidota bacterium]MBU1113620.1 biotin--[acetyl-CoA-carboxylase] ligase [Bacteroidota bacterium]MBU1797758.1 biotin--[acetyl-CoA-carboxylase] ligase [Bacteroidota bacterium]